jgi:hypothetical protein
MRVLTEHTEPDMGSLGRSLELAVERLGWLTTTVDAFSASRPLAGNSGLRAQLRRSAIDALSHTARAFEEDSSCDRDRLLMRSLAALRELRHFAHLAGVSRCLTKADVSRLDGLSQDAGAWLQQALSNCE